MDKLNEIILFTSTTVILYLVPLIAGLYLIELVFRNRFKTRKALRLVSCVILFFALMGLVHYVIGTLVSPELYAFSQRANGPYGWAYWIMTVSATLLPFALLVKKLASKFLFVLLIAVSMKIGFYFERFVIIVTSLHRDYFPYDNDSIGMIIPVLIVGFFLKGLVLAVLTLFLIEVSERIQSRFKPVKAQ